MWGEAAFAHKRSKKYCPNDQNFGRRNGKSMSQGRFSSGFASQGIEATVTDG